MDLRIRAAATFVCASVACTSFAAHADEGGVSFWLPGQYGSFAAIAPSPGWSLPLVYYNYGGSKGAQRVLPNGGITGALSGSFDGVFIVPTYTVDTTILGAVPSFSMAVIPATSAASANLGAVPLSRSRSNSVCGGSDLYPTAQLFWNKGGVNNVMAYLTGDIPVGSYNPDRLANIGIGHGAIDGGGAYTYLDTKTGTEFSATLGFTGNFENPSTHYTNGIDFASRSRGVAVPKPAAFRRPRRLCLPAVDPGPRPAGPPRPEQVAHARRRPADRRQLQRRRRDDLREPPRLLGVRFLPQASGPRHLRHAEHPSIRALCGASASAVSLPAWTAAR